MQWLLWITFQTLMGRDSFVCHSAANSNCTQIVTRKLIDKSVGWIHSFLCWTSIFLFWGDEQQNAAIWQSVSIHAYNSFRAERKGGKELTFNPHTWFCLSAAFDRVALPTCSVAQAASAIKKRWSGAGTACILPSHGCAVGCNLLTSLQNTAVAVGLGPCYPCSSFIESQNGRVLKDHPAPTPAVGLLPSYQVRPPNAALEMAGDWVLGLGGTSSFRI